MRVGLIGGVGLAFGAADAEAEQVAEAADVAAGGEGFVEDAVLADRIRRAHETTALAAWRDAKPHDTVRIIRAIRAGEAA